MIVPEKKLRERKNKFFRFTEILKRAKPRRLEKLQKPETKAAQTKEQHQTKVNTWTIVLKQTHRKSQSTQPGVTLGDRTIFLNLTRQQKEIGSLCAKLIIFAPKLRKKEEAKRKAKVLCACCHGNTSVHNLTKNTAYPTRIMWQKLNQWFNPNEKVQIGFVDIYKNSRFGLKDSYGMVNTVVGRRGQ